MQESRWLFSLLLGVMRSLDRNLVDTSLLQVSPVLLVRAAFYVLRGASAWGVPAWVIMVGYNNSVFLFKIDYFEIF